MKSMRVVVLSLVSMLVLRSARQESSVCALLTAADIEAVTGGKASAPVPGGNAANGQMRMCMWSVAANKGGLTLSTGLLPPGTSAVALAKKNAGVDALRAAEVHRGREGLRQRILLGDVATSVAEGRRIPDVVHGWLEGQGILAGVHQPHPEARPRPDEGIAGQGDQPAALGWRRERLQTTTE